jgi:hypothetical protein
MTDQPRNDDVAHDGAAGARELPDPLLPDQPVEAERPVPLRAAPERTADPSDWDVEGSDTVRPRPREEQVELGPEAGRDLRVSAPDWVESQSSYSTELQQGAVHPRPTTQDDESEPDGSQDHGQRD